MIHYDNSIQGHWKEIDESVMTNNNVISEFNAYPMSYSLVGAWLVDLCFWKLYITFLFQQRSFSGIG